MITLIKFTAILLSLFFTVSCGTIAGVGRDIQSIGRTMEQSENRRVVGLKTPKPVVQPNTAYGYVKPNYPMR